MANWMGWIPAALGALVVMQAGLNRKVSALWGFPPAVFLNSVVLVVSASLLMLLTKPQFEFRHFSPWFILPGLCGLAVVYGGAWSVSKWGASYTFILIISSQLVSSVLWDLMVEKTPVSKERLLGALLAWGGAWLATRGK